MPWRFAGIVGDFPVSRRPDVTVEMVRSFRDGGLSIKAIAGRLECSYALVRSRLPDVDGDGRA